LQTKREWWRVSVVPLICGCVLGLCHVSGYLGNDAKSLSGWVDEGFDEAQMKFEIVEESVLFAFVFVLFRLLEVQLCQGQYVHQTNSVLTRYGAGH
jgi:hypothetical protein